MGRARLISTTKCDTIVSASEKFIIYKVPVKNVGLFHSAEVEGGFVIVKFFPKTEEAKFRVENKNET